MENFAFHQFVGQIYQAAPALQHHDDLVRQFLRDELKGRKSFVVDESVVAKAQAFVDKRVNVTQVGNQLLQNDAMLFQHTATTTSSAAVAISGSTPTPDNSNATALHNDTDVAFSQKSSYNLSSRVGAFLFGFFLGGILVGALFVYNFVLAPTNQWPILF